ncbi:MAG: flagellar biosynthetic protein FliR [Thermoleophilaceae bacterium]|nr:flagellar biosynthetic protein FliR [Thermoleophilaceae bacterium]
MNELLTRLSEQQTASFMLVLARVSPLFLLAPVFSSRMLPARARGIAAVALAIGMAPLATRGRPVPLGGADLGGLVVKEILVGLAFAFAVGATIAAVSAAGSFLDTAIGFSYGSVIDPITGAQSQVLSQLYGLVGVLIFIAIGGDAWVVQGLARTYDLVPLDAMPSIPDLVGGAQHAFVGIFGSALEIAAPVLLAVIVTDAAFGLVSRVVPQLNVFAVGMPAKIAVGLLIMGVSLPFVGGWIGDQVEQSVSSALQALKVAG